MSEEHGNLENIDGRGGLKGSEGLRAPCLCGGCKHGLGRFEMTERYWGRRTICGQ